MLFEAYPVNADNPYACVDALCASQTRGSRFLKYQELRIQELVRHTHDSSVLLLASIITYYYGT
jgi:hypothetical protein